MTADETAIAATDDDTAATIAHEKATLDCLLIRAAHAECLANYWFTHPEYSAATRAVAADLCIKQRDLLMQHYEHGRREFQRTHRRRAVLSRVPGQLRRLISRLFCQPTPLRHTYPLPTGDDQ